MIIIKFHSPPRLLPSTSHHSSHPNHPAYSLPLCQPSPHPLPCSPLPFHHQHPCRSHSAPNLWWSCQRSRCSSQRRRVSWTRIWAEVAPSRSWSTVRWSRSTKLWQPKSWGFDSKRKWGARSRTRGGRRWRKRRTTTLGLDESWHQPHKVSRPTSRRDGLLPPTSPRSPPPLSGYCLCPRRHPRLRTF